MFFTGEKASVAYARAGVVLLWMAVALCLIVLIWTADYWFQWLLTILVLVFSAAGLSNWADSRDD